MSYKITTSYNWYETDFDKFLIRTFMINEVPFTFNEIPKISQDDPEILEEASQNPVLTPTYFYHKSFYLIDEEMHPCLYELDLENPEILDEIEEYSDS